ncbi:MAG TPA: MerR family transcriptional regulator [Aestuariivirga sp.]
MYTVKQVAEMAGVSVRTLHHYHDIGLLKPADLGDNGYRYYGRDELIRLQQILIYREMEIPLNEIGTLLDAQAHNMLIALQSQREKLSVQANRYAEMLGTIDRTIAQLKGESAMKDAELYSGIVDPQKQSVFEDWLENRFGPEFGDQIRSSGKDFAAKADDERKAFMDELRGIEESLAESCRKAIPPQSMTLDPLLARHWQWVQDRWAKSAPISAYSSLADTYLAHPEFVARYETVQKDFANYLATAMKSWAARQN